MEEKTMRWKERSAEHNGWVGHSDAPWTGECGGISKDLCLSSVRVALSLNNRPLMSFAVATSSPWLGLSLSSSLSLSLSLSNL